MNPFEQLRIDDDAASPASPDPRFASRLRAQLEAALSPVVQLPERLSEQKDRATMTDTATTTAATTQILVPYIAVDDAAAALDWYADALDGIETVRYVGDDGRIGHAEMTIHGARIMLSDAYPEIGVVDANSYEGSSCALHLEVDDIDALHDAAVAAGATSQRDPADQAHGARTSTVVDPFGHRWMFSQTISTPTAAEIDAATDGFTVIESVAVGTGDALAGSTGPGRPIQLGYYTIHTADIAKAASFYATVLGWQVDPESGHVSNCDLPFGFQTDYGDGVRLWMQVSDADPVIERILANGGEVVEDTMYESGRGVECRDDQGQRFDLHHPAAGYES